MSSVAHATAGQTTEMPSNSETAIGGEVVGSNIAPKDSASTEKAGQQQGDATRTSSEPGSAEAAAEKLFEERMEDEYAKRDGGA